MRPLAGPAMLLVMTVGYVVFRLTSSEDLPPRSFTELEFAGADDDRTGACYSLDTLLFANRVGSSAARTWTSPRDDVWVLLVDDVIQGNGGPVRDFQKYTFEKDRDHVRLTAVETTRGSGDADEHIDGFISIAKVRNSTPIDRCLEPGATGYNFKPKR